MKFWKPFLYGACGCAAAIFVLIAIMGKIGDTTKRIQFDAFMVGCAMAHGERATCRAEAEKFIKGARP